MTKKFIGAILLSVCAVTTASAKEYLISTPKSSIVITAQEGKKALFQYYGAKLEESEVPSIFAANIALKAESYPAYGTNSIGDKAISVTHADGNISLDLIVVSVSQSACADGQLTEIVHKDSHYPFVVKQYFKAYDKTDIISTWVEITNNARKPVTLYKFASSILPIKRAENHLVHLHGDWAGECELTREELTNGSKSIVSKNGVRSTRYENPSFMITIDGAPQEESGAMIGATLAWGGNYKIDAIASNTSLNILSGILEDNSQYILDPKCSFTTPELAMTYTTEGMGGVSRAFHKWGRTYMLNQGDVERDILLNSWEGVHFDVDQQEMYDMIGSIARMGGELFVMDDGWFGNKHARNDGTSGLGDWDVCKAKLPEGVEGLIECARKNNIKFGIWIEPEMVNTNSELYEKHPDWAIVNDNHTPYYGRGKTQLTLDMSNPKVQDFVFDIVDNLMTTYPDLYYIKWDANNDITSYGSSYLPRNKQSHIAIAYQEGLISVLKRIRAKYPKLIIQDCSSGGGRVSYGYLPYFEEFWTSDNTDALQRIYMQWGTSTFYPAIAMASHVSCTVNHQTQRTTPLKFRFDVAMSGRLGMEMQPKDMTEEEVQYATRCIESYKRIRPVVQFGELYRLISPYDDKNVASLMYASEDKSHAVAYAYKINSFRNETLPNVRFSGLDPEKNYKITDLSPVDPSKPCPLNGRVISGKVLKETGISLTNILRTPYSSMAIELVEVK